MDKQHFCTLEGHYFRLLRRALKIKASYYSRISNFRVWKAAQRPVLPSQHILSQQFKLLIKSMTTPPAQPLHHVVFSRGYKDRIRFSKPKSRGHPAKYWFELVSKQALIFHNRYLDHTPHESSRDIKGVARLAQKDPEYGSSLVTAPTRQPALFQLYSKTIGTLFASLCSNPGCVVMVAWHFLWQRYGFWGFQSLKLYRGYMLELYWDYNGVLLG